MVQSDEWRELFRCSFHQLAGGGFVDRRQDLSCGSAAHGLHPLLCFSASESPRNWRGGRVKELKGGKGEEGKE